LTGASTRGKSEWRTERDITNPLEEVNREEIPEIRDLVFQSLDPSLVVGENDLLGALTESIECSEVTNKEVTRGQMVFDRANPHLSWS
jgi:hypothetical protein